MSFAIAEINTILQQDNRQQDRASNGLIPPNVLLARLNEEGNQTLLETVLRMTFERLQRDLVEGVQLCQRYAGTTACFTLCFADNQGRLNIMNANVGNSSAHALITNPDRTISYRQLSPTAHDLFSETERRRILQKMDTLPPTFTFATVPAPLYEEYDPSKTVIYPSLPRISYAQLFVELDKAKSQLQSSNQQEQIKARKYGSNFGFMYLGCNNDRISITRDLGDVPIAHDPEFHFTTLLPGASSVLIVGGSKGVLKNGIMGEEQLRSALSNNPTNLGAFTQAVITESKRNGLLGDDKTCLAVRINPQRATDGSGFFCITCDGHGETGKHGGGDVAEYVAENAGRIFIEELKQQIDLHPIQPSQHREINLPRSGHGERWGREEVLIPVGPLAAPSSEDNDSPLFSLSR